MDIKKIKETWDDFSKYYKEEYGKSTASLMNVLISLSKLKDKQTILESGCGPGLTSKMLSFHSNPNSIIYAFDLSTEMINLCKEEFENYGYFNYDSQNYWGVIEASNKQINIEEDNKEIRSKHKGQIVKFFDANVEVLPFVNEQFDLYISNLCIMLCQDPDSAINEAFRVTKQGGMAVLSIWGAKEKSKHFQIYIFEALNRINANFTPATANNYKLAEDPKLLKERFHKAGFKKVITEYSSVMVDVFTVKDYLLRFIVPSTMKIISQLDDEKKEEFYKELTNIVKEKMEDKDEIPLLSTMVIVAFK